MKRQNDKLHFVVQTVKQIGYPRWDKAIAVSKTDASVNGRGQTADSANIYYIPFVRDSQNYVNASLIIKTFPTDTTFLYKCDWQYSLLQNNTNSVSDSSEYLAIFFMTLDRHVFGHTKFAITDTSIFNKSGKPLYITLDTSNTSGKSNILTPVQFCQEVTITFEFCPWIFDQGFCYGPGGTCDNCGACFGAMRYQYCWIEYIDDGSGGGGSGGGTGGSSGGGGTGTPPECGEPLQPLAGRTNVVDPCGPGWVPDYGDGENYPPSPTNDSTIAENLKRLMQKANNIPDSLHNIAQQDGNERTFSFIINGTDTAVMYIKTGTTHTSSPVLSSSTIAIFHTHQEDDTTGGSDRNQCFDGPDIYKLYKNVAIDGYQIAASIISTRDYYYAAVITDKYKFRDYIRTICGTQNLNQINYRLNEIHIDAMDLCVPPPVCNWERKTELGALAITANNDATVSGIKIFKSNKQSINFTLLIP